jgi:dCTP deaminase
MTLSDKDLMRLYPGSRPGPASIDLHLGHELKFLRREVVFDPEADQSDEWMPLPLGQRGPDAGRWRLHRGRPYLGVTAETISVSDEHVGLLHGNSSLGRLFLLIHVTAGLVDSGWKKSPLTLELMPLGADIYLRPGMRIGQITLHELTSKCLTPYGHPSRQSKYAGDQGATPSRMFRESPIGQSTAPACAGLSSIEGTVAPR